MGPVGGDPPGAEGHEDQAVRTSSEPHRTPLRSGRRRREATHSVGASWRRFAQRLCDGAQQFVRRAKRTGLLFEKPEDNGVQRGDSAAGATATAHLHQTSILLEP